MTNKAKITKSRNVLPSNCKNYLKDTLELTLDEKYEEEYGNHKLKMSGEELDDSVIHKDSDIYYTMSKKVMMSVATTKDN